MNKKNKDYTAMPAMKASEDALLNEAKASAVANDAIIPRRPHRGGGWEGVSPIKRRKEFFESLEAGLQSYFDNYDSEWGGILHLTIGVRCGEVGGIIKSADAFGASVATTEGLSSQRSAALPLLRYEGFSRQRIEQILRYVLPRYVKRSEVDYAVDDVINELLGINTSEEEPKAEVVQVTAEPLPEKKSKKRRPTPKECCFAALLGGTKAPAVATDAHSRRPSMEGLAESTEVEMQAVVVEPLPEKKAKRKPNKKSKKQ